VSSWSGPPSNYKWTRATLHQEMHDLGFKFKAGPKHYDVAREKRTVIAQRESFIEKRRAYRENGRTIYYTDETWANKNMTPRRTWADGGLQAQLEVPSGKGARIIIAHVGSRETGLEADAGLVFVGKKKSGDYHGEMNSDLWLKWPEQTVLPKIPGGVLVVNCAPYHMKLTAETRPASSKMRKADLADWLKSHDAVPDGWPTTWRQSMTVKQMYEQASNNRPTPRFIVQDLAEKFGVSVLISPVAHPELSPIEMVWGTVKVALRRCNVLFSLARLEELEAVEFAKISAEVWARYEDHAIGMEDYYSEVPRMREEVEKRLDEQAIELEEAEGDGVNKESDGASDADGRDLGRAAGSESDFGASDAGSEGSSAMEEDIHTRSKAT